jgi:DNA (cytosine-5)-methyltransferase 1
MLGFGAIAKRLRPTWLVWENVPGVLSANGGRDFGTFLGMLAELGYGFAYRVLDAQFFGVAQRRKRVFVVGYIGDWRPAAAVLFERESLSGNSAPSRETKEEVTGTLSSRTSGGPIAGTLRASLGGGDKPHVMCFAENSRSEVRLEGGDGSLAGALSTGGGKPGQGRPTICVQNATPINTQMAVRPVAFGQNRSSGPVHVSHALTGHAGPVGRLDFSSETFLVQPVQYNGMAVRRLTPIECERLQGFPDNFTKIPYRGKTVDKCPDGPRYKALGNSMSVPCMKWIGERIQQVQEITQNNKVKKR